MRTRATCTPSWKLMHTRCIMPALYLFTSLRLQYVGETDPFSASFLGTLRCVVVSELAVYQRIGCMTAGSGRTCTTQRQDVVVAGLRQRCLQPRPPPREGSFMRDLGLDISFSVAAPKLHVPVDNFSTPTTDNFSCMDNTDCRRYERKHSLRY